MYQENPNDYSREDRLRVSWWSSHRGRGGPRTKTGRAGRRITLIDMLLLAVAAGVLVPWILSMDRGLELGPYKVDVDIRERRSDTLIRIEFALVQDAAGDADDSLIGWNLLDGEGNRVHQEMDLPPLPGRSRIFRYIGEVGETWSIVIHAGDENRSIGAEG